MNKTSFGYLMIAAFVCVALAAVVGGIALTGLPAEQRLIALDKKRVGDLRWLELAVRRYQTRNGVLPASLAVISAERVAHLSDPVTEEPYTYRVTGERSFQLCAIFARRNDKTSRYPFKAHEQGFHCFDHEIERKAK